MLLWHSEPLNCGSQGSENDGYCEGFISTDLTTHQSELQKFRDAATFSLRSV